MSSASTYTIRLAEMADAAAVAAIYRPFVEDSGISWEYEAPDTEEMAKRIAQVQERHAWLVTERAGRVYGFCYGTAHRSRAGYAWASEVSVYVHADHRKQGMARALYSALFRILTALGYRKLLAGIALPNAASTHLHRALGFEQVARYPNLGFKQGAWLTTEWYLLQVGGTGAPQRLKSLRDLDANTLQMLLGNETNALPNADVDHS